MSDDIHKRLKMHNSGKVRSTKGYRPWKILYSEEFETREQAREREKFLKSGYGRAFLKSIGL